MRRYDTIPHPFILDSGEPARARASTTAVQSLRLGLFGQANRHLSTIVFALSRAAAEGIGKGRMPLDLIAVNQNMNWDDATWSRIYTPDESLNAHTPDVPAIPTITGPVTVTFKTPLRLMRENKCVEPDTFSFHDLFGNLLRRLSMLTYFYGETALETDFAALNHHARAVVCRARNLHWYNWTRYSSRQQGRIGMGGLMGSITLDSTDIAPFWPYLWLGQWTHAGKGTSMGLGRYVINAAASLPEAAYPTIEATMWNGVDTPPAASMHE
jgi:hypothetical protein